MNEPKMRRMICLLLFAVACGEEVEKGGAPSADDSGSAEVEVVDCSMAIPGVSWGDPPVTDFNPNITTELEALDLGAIPEELDISALLPLFRGGIAYALEIPPSDLGSSLSKADLLAAGDLGLVVLASLATDDDLGIDFTIFRQGLQRYYTCSRAFPRTLDGFKALYGDFGDAFSEIDSAAKCGTRRVQENHAAGVFVAESVWGEEVRETEILLRGARADGQLEFLVYGADGLLTDRSQFPTMGGGPHLVTSAPYTCMTCHLNSEADDDTFAYDVLTPHGTGACAD